MLKDLIMNKRKLVILEKVNVTCNYFYGDTGNQNTIAKFDFQDEAEIIPINDFEQVYGIERNIND